MAIKIVTLSNPVVTTADDGTVSVTGVRDEKSVLSGISTIALAPTKFNSDDAYVSESTMAVASTVWAALGFHLADYMHADSKEDAKSPITGLFL